MRAVKDIFLYIFVAIYIAVLVTAGTLGLIQQIHGATGGEYLLQKQIVALDAEAAAAQAKTAEARAEGVIWQKQNKNFRALIVELQNQIELLECELSPRCISSLVMNRR